MNLLGQRSLLKIGFCFGPKNPLTKPKQKPEMFEYSLVGSGGQNEYKQRNDCAFRRQSTTWRKPRRQGIFQLRKSPPAQCDS